MGLFDGLKLKKQRKEKDRIIKQAEDMWDQRNYQGAIELLDSILSDTSDEDAGYRRDEIRKLKTFCKMVIEENTIAYQEKRAENGDVEAMFRVATKYQESGEDHNPEKAFYWMKKAAETGYIPAMYRVAMLYQNGTGTDVNLEQAAIWYKKVTECNLGTYIELAEDKLKEIEAAQKTQSEKTVEIAQEPAQVPENKILNEIDGKDGQTWHKEAIEYYHNKKYTQALLCAENAAKLGVVKAMHNTAAMYRMGLGTQADEAKAFQWFEKAAMAGSYEDMFMISGLYWNGEGVERDDEKSFYWRKKAAEEGDKPEYWFGLAHAYDNGIGTEKDAEKAFYWLEKAAQGGIPEAIGYCAARYDAGISVAQNKAKALYWYEKAAEAGDTKAMMECYHRYSYAIGTERDENKVAHWLTEALNAGSPDAYYEVARLHIENPQKEGDVQTGYQMLEEIGEQGIVKAMLRLAEDYCKANEDSRVEKDMSKAFYWYEKAANAGDSRAMFETSLCYLYGTGVAKDDDKAYKWLDAALDAGEVEAFQFMSQMYYESAEKNNNPEDYESALHWAELAARGGHEDAKRNLVPLYLNCHANELKKEQPDLDRVIYYTDSLLETDFFPTLSPDLQIGFLRPTVVTLMKYSNNKAYGEHILHYLELAAELGDVESMNVLSALWITDEYIERDEEKAFHWRKKAAEHGMTSAMIALGNYYEDGVGVAQNPEEALYWYEKAAENGDEEAYLQCAMIILHNTEVRGYTLEEAIEHFKYWQDKAVNCENEEVRNRNLEVMKELGFIK